MLTSSLVQDIKQIWKNAQAKAYTLVNRALIDAYWEIGQRIINEEQGPGRAAYAKFLLRDLADKLAADLGKQLDERELRRCRQFFTLFPIRDALRPELTWSHYRLLIRIEDPAVRHCYCNESADHNWGDSSVGT